MVNNDESGGKYVIDEEKTYREKGYYSTDLTPNSGREVWAICEGEECQREKGRGRWVKKCNYRDLCHSCAHRTDEWREKNRAIKTQYHKDHPDARILQGIALKKRFESDPGIMLVHSEFVKKHHRDNPDIQTGKNNPNWKGGTSRGDYCKLFNEPLKDAIRNYFGNVCFECSRDIEKNNDKKMSVHHVNYQKSCGCDNTQFCIYVPLCNSCHSVSNGNRWYWYLHFMTDIALRNPNYYAYHIPVVYYDEPSYNYGYVFEKQRR